MGESRPSSPEPFVWADPQALNAYQRQEALARHEAGETLTTSPGPKACPTQRSGGFDHPLSLNQLAKGRWSYERLGRRALKALHHDAGAKHGARVRQSPGRSRDNVASPT